MSRPKRCKRCGKRWCGTDLKLIELWGPNYMAGFDGKAATVTYGSKRCRDKGSKRKS